MDTSKTDPIAFDATPADAEPQMTPAAEQNHTETADSSQVDKSEQPVNPAEEPNAEEFIPRAEAEQMAREAYLRGRNERLKADWVDADQPAPDDSLAALFATRPSVWNR